MQQADLAVHERDGDAGGAGQDAGYRVAREIALLLGSKFHVGIVLVKNHVAVKRAGVEGVRGRG